MSDETPASAPPPPPGSIQPPPPSRQKSKVPTFLLGRWGFLVIGLVAGGIIGGAAGAGSKSGTTSTGPIAAASPVASPTQAAPAPTTPSPLPSPTDTSPYVPDPSDFQLGVKILSKQCFGSAGCNLTYRITVSYSGLPLDPSVTYEVTYQVRGDESGPQINTLTVTGDQSSVEQEEIASTRSSAVKLTATAISVDVLSS